MRGVYSFMALAGLLLIVVIAVSVSAVEYTAVEGAVSGKTASYFNGLLNVSSDKAAYLGNPHIEGEIAFVNNYAEITAASVKWWHYFSIQLDKGKATIPVKLYQWAGVRVSQNVSTCAVSGTVTNASGTYDVTTCTWKLVEQTDWRWVPLSNGSVSLPKGVQRIKFAFDVPVNTGGSFNYSVKIFNGVSNISLLLDPLFNSSFLSMRAFNLSDNEHPTRTNEPQTINFTGLTLRVGCNETIIVMNYTDNVSVPREVLNQSDASVANGSKWCLIKFNANISTAQNTTHAQANNTVGWIYYNSPFDLSGIANSTNSAWSDEYNATYEPDGYGAGAWAKTTSGTCVYGINPASNYFQNCSNDASGNNYTFYAKTAIFSARGTVEVRYKAVNNTAAFNGVRAALVIHKLGGNKAYILVVNRTGFRLEKYGTAAIWGYREIPTYWDSSAVKPDANNSWHTYRLVFNMGQVWVYVDNVYSGLNTTTDGAAIDVIRFGESGAASAKDGGFWDYVTYQLGDTWTPLNVTVGDEQNLTLPDTTPPWYWEGNLTDPESPAAFNAVAAYKLSINWSDNVALSMVRLEFNGSNYSNTSGLNNSRYNFTFNNLPVGNYSYYWFANDTKGNANVTPVLWYNITPGFLLVTLTINGSQANKTTLNGTFNITATTNASGIPCWLNRNGSLLTQGNSPLSNTTLYQNYTQVWVWQATCGNSNYTNSTSIALWLNIITNLPEVTPIEEAADVNLLGFTLVIVGVFFIFLGTTTESYVFQAALVVLGLIFFTGALLAFGIETPKLRDMFIMSSMGPFALALLMLVAYFVKTTFKNVFGGEA